jgi:predicted CXXCH cytochrome family protein
VLSRTAGGRSRLWCLLGRRPALLVVLGACLMLAGVSVAPSGEAPKAQKAEEPPVIFPPSRAVLLSGSFHVIVKGIDGPLKVDGQAQPWEAFEPPVRAARLGLASGTHEVEIGSRRIEFVVGAGPEEHDGPKDWPVFHFHPITNDAKRCEVCHEIGRQNKKMTLGAVKPMKHCYDCHRAVEVEATHSHPMNSLENCVSCHVMHGSRRKSSLRAPPKQLCSECHES